MGEATRIGIYLRLRPARRAGAGRVAADAEGGWVEFSVPKDAAQGLINNSKESYKFHFDGIFGPEAQQDTVFEAIARPAVAEALDGINGTVFAYGQTGSGKTFTVTGGTERYADRGLIPRALAAVYAEIARRPTHTYTVQCSYLELYNEEGFDLLDPSREVKRLEDLPKVSVMEDDDGRMHIRNLTAHRTANEEEALNLLFLGDTNRMVAETPLNQASSRSHAIFTLHIEARKAGDDRVRRSKLNFVDLAGSERVTKTGIEGATLKEAKYINLSLHYLEQVIIALQEGRPHVPYRNSLLTQMLKDSLGGNCRTVMIANVAPEAQHTEESISTCRFAQRVAMISNQVTVNEELDPALVIKRLRAENQQLRQELQLLKGGAGPGGGGEEGGSAGAGAGEGEGGGEGAARQPWQHLSEEERGRLRQQVLAYVEDGSPEAQLEVEASMVVIRTAFSMLKDMLKELAAANPRRAGPVLKRLHAAAATAGGGGQGVGAAAQQAGDLQQQAQQAERADEGGSLGDEEELSGLSREVESLRSALQRKEREVALLVGMLRKQGAADPQAAAAAAAAAEEQGRAGAGLGGARPGSSAGVAQQQQQLLQPQPQPEAGTVPPLNDDMLVDQNRAFDYFCASSPTHDSVQEGKALLRSKYEEAKALGAQVNGSKQRIAELRGLIEQRRVQRSMAALMQGQPPPECEDPEEERAKGLVDKEKGLYREALGQLKDLKAEIDRLQALLDHSRARLQREFQSWYALVLRTLGPERQQRIQQAQQAAAKKQQQGAEGSAGEGTLEEWRIASVPAATAAPLGGPHVAPAAKGSLAQQLSPGLAQSQQPLALARGEGSALLRPPSRQESAGAVVQPSFSTWSAAASAPQQLAAASSSRAPSRAQTPRRLASGQPEQAPPGLLPSGSSLVGGPGPGAAAPAALGAAAAAAAASAGAGGPDYSNVDPEVLRAARPLLMGNAAADADIIKFYTARAELLRQARAYR